MRIGLGMIVHCHVSHDYQLSQCFPTYASGISFATNPSVVDGETVSTKDIWDFRRDPADTDDDFSLALLFDQYIRSPSPPPASSPTSAIGESSGITLPDTELGRHRCMESYNNPVSDVRETEGAGTEAEDRCGISNGPRIRLRVSQPRIMLRLRLRDESTCR
jgi:hypothetical protein